MDQFDFFIAAKRCPKIKEWKEIIVSMGVWENEDTLNSRVVSLAVLKQGTEQFPAQCIHGDLNAEADHPLPEPHESASTPTSG